MPIMIYKSTLLKDWSKHLYWCARNVSTSTKIYTNGIDNLSNSEINFKLQSLNLKSNIRKSIKHESFVKRAFFGELDKDYLKFPKLKDGIRLLQEQYNFICQNFKPSNLTEKGLNNSGFYNLDQFTLYELSHLFEAIGASLNTNLNYFNSNLSKSLVPVGEKIVVTDSFLINYDEKKSFISTVLPLIIHNSLVCSALESSSATIKQNILPQSKIGFAFCEPDDNFVSLPYPFWNSSAIYDKENNAWILNGTKSRILKGDYDHFIVYCKTSQNESDHHGIESFLIPKNLVRVDFDGYDNHGTEYLKISFNNLNLPEEMHRLSSMVDNKSVINQPFSALNIKARGQLVTSAVILGIIKESIRNLSKMLQNTTNDMPSKQIVEEKLILSTQLIYSLESMLYQTCDHFDKFDENHHDLFLDAMAIKILATEYASEIMNMLRLALDCQQMSSVVASGLTDILNVLDSFLDSSTSNRLLLATYGLKSIGQWNFDHIAKMRLRRIYAKHFFKYIAFSSYKKNVLQRSKTSMDDYESLKSLHQSLNGSANSLETVLQICSDMGDQILISYGKDCINHQIDLDRFASILLSSFQMVSVISRANDSLMRRDTNSDNELFLCREICRRQLEFVKQNQVLIEGILDTTVEKRSKAIHKRNIRFDGYFAKPTFDRII